MLNYDIIDVFEGIDVNKTSRSKECNISTKCLQGCHDFLMMPMNLFYIDILNIKGAN